MSDVRTRALERAAEIDPAVRPVLEAAKLRDGSAVHGPHLPPPLDYLGWLVSLGLTADRAGAETRSMFGLAKLPSGARKRVDAAQAKRERLMVAQARRVPLTHRHAASARAEITAACVYANGRRRVRTVSAEEAIADMLAAANGRELRDYGRVETVANAYRKHALDPRTTCTTAVRVGKRVAFWVSEASAFASARHTPWLGNGPASPRERMAAAVMAGSVEIGGLWWRSTPTVILGVGTVRALAVEASQ